MKLALRSSLLTLAVILFTFGSAHSQGWSLFGSKGRTAAHTRYSIVEEYKEAYRPGGARSWFSGKKKHKAVRSYARTHRSSKKW